MMNKNQIQYPKVLIVSHNVLSNNTNMGRTLSTYFSGWDRNAIAQLFFHSEIPTNPICENYYQFTDIDAVKSIICRKHQGKKLSKDDIRTDLEDAVNTGSLTGIYNYGRKRSPMIYLARDTVWTLAAWRCQSLIDWIDRFNPDILFFASGDYEFAYQVTKSIAEERNIPLVVLCVDDYYLFNTNEKKIIGRYRYNRFMHTVRETMNYACCILTMNEMMAGEYKRLFGKECYVLYTAAKKVPLYTGDKKGIAYIGGLGLNRDKQLIEIAKALNEINEDKIPRRIDLYTGEKDPVILSRIKAEEGIDYHGQISGDQVADTIQHSKAVIHTESFDPGIRKRVKYSLSTKIPDSIASGTCMFAYGPEEVASIDYLIRNNAAFVATSPDKIKTVLIRLFTDESEYKRIAENAYALACRNHDGEKTTGFVLSLLTEKVKSFKENC